MSGRAPSQAEGLRGLVGPKAEKSVSLALQGGGSHGAFTWGVLDAILEDGRIAIEAMTGASAGAMNAIALADGWQQGGAEGARARLEEFWRRVSLGGSLSPMQQGVFDRMMGIWHDDDSPGRFWLDMFKPFATPYKSNPLDINPLRDALSDLINFENVRNCSQVQIFISATNVWTGKIRNFRREELGVDHLLASACLPQVFKAVEIEGVPYWDGGYVGNPPLYPLFYGIATDDVLLVQINPIERRETPQTAREIANRLSEITFNNSLLKELRAVEFVMRLIDEGKLSRDDYKRVFMHRIDPAGYLDDFPASSRIRAEWSSISTLKERGRAAGAAWITRHYEDLGVRGTMDTRREIG